MSTAPHVNDNLPMFVAQPSADILEYALDYINRGLAVIPLHGTTEQGYCACRMRQNCPENSAGKHPVLQGWQHAAFTKAEAIEQYHETTPLQNIGVQLGPRSRIVAFDCDDAEAEKTYSAICGFDAPVVPTFISKRGKKRIFKFRSGLPQQAKVSIGKLDVLIGNNDAGQQMVVPPSARRLRNGETVNYEWAPGLSLDDVNPGDFTDDMLARFNAAIAAGKESPVTEERPGAVTLSTLKEALDHLNPKRADDYSTGAWLDVGMVLCVATRGSDDGLQLWDKWSQQSPQYQAGVCEDKWNSFSREAAPGQQNIGSLFHWAMIDSPGWKPPKPGPQQSEFKIDLLTSEQFDSAEFQIQPLITKILVANQFAMTGGAQKVMKTSIALDEGVSLSTGTPFLGTFDVPRAVPVLIISGESGGFVLRDKTRRICEAKGVLFRTTPIHWAFTVPQIGLSAHLDGLVKIVEKESIEVAYLDPAFMSMLVGDDGKPINFANLFETGAVLGRAAAAFAGVGCTLKLLHHETKSAQNFRRRSNDFSPPELQDLSQSGFAEAVRQWQLIGRREPYKQGSGVHRLWLNVGGSAGHGGLWAVDIDEGVIQDDFSGRKWEVVVHTASQERAVQATQTEQRRTEKQQQKDDEDRGRLMQVYRETFPEGETQEQLRGAARLSGAKFTFVNQQLITEGLVEKFDLQKRGRPRDGYRLKPNRQDGVLDFDQGAK